MKNDFYIFSIQGNEIGAEGAEMIGEVLITNNTLTSLNLRVHMGNN